jgi:nucleotide-binding universal stress UspA family protein
LARRSVLTAAGAYLLPLTAIRPAAADQQRTRRLLTGAKGPAPGLAACCDEPCRPGHEYEMAAAGAVVTEGKEQAMPGIVVGVDGSPNSERALDWAMKQAAAVHAPLTVIAVHEVPKSYWGGIPVIGPADEPLLGKLRQAAEDMTQRAASRLGDARPASVTVHAVSGFVVKELVDASQDADLVVVGARGGSGFARVLVGSVSSEVVQHSACPVVIVPHQR